jgi:acyl dehydratase
MITLTGRAGLEEKLGEELGVSSWLDVTQEAVDAFADATGDHQWIHVDVERARASEFGGTIAHGYFTLSLGPKLADEVYALDGFAFGLNYGLDKLRYPAMLPVGGKVRLRATLTDVTPTPDGGLRVGITHTFEGEDRDGESIAKPVCVAAVLLFVQPED